MAKKQNRCIVRFLIVTSFIIFSSLSLGGSKLQAQCNEFKLASCLTGGGCTPSCPGGALMTSAQSGNSSQVGLCVY